MATDTSRSPGCPGSTGESPLNSIWEGSGNVIALDVLRAMGRSSDTLAAVNDEIELARGVDARFDDAVKRLHAELGDPEDCPAGPSDRRPAGSVPAGVIAPAARPGGGGRRVLRDPSRRRLGSRPRHAAGLWQAARWWNELRSRLSDRPRTDYSRGDGFGGPDSCVGRSRTVILPYADGRPQRTRAGTCNLTTSGFGRVGRPAVRRPRRRLPARSNRSITLRERGRRDAAGAARPTEMLGRRLLECFPGMRGHGRGGALRASPHRDRAAAGSSTSTSRGSTGTSSGVYPDQGGLAVFVRDIDERVRADQAAATRSRGS